MERMEGVEGMGDKLDGIITLKRMEKWGVPTFHPLSVPHSSILHFSILLKQ